MVATQCRKCNAIESYITRVSIQGLSAPLSATPGDTVIVSFIATNDLTGPGTSLAACLYDDSSGQIITGTDVMGIAGYGAQVPVTLQFTMPSRNVNLNLSLIEPLILTNRCDDFKLFTITAQAPPGQGYSCNSSTRTCYQDSNSTVTYDQCQVNCSGGGGGGGFGQCSPACTSSDMCVLGACIPKPLVFVGIAGFLFMMMSGGRK